MLRLSAVCRLVVSSTFIVLFSSGAIGAQVTATLAGRVVSERDGSALAGALVTVAGRPVEASTAADGSFTLTGLPAGAVTVTISRPGFTALTQEVSLTPGATLRLDVRLPPVLGVSEELTVLGRVSDYVEATAGASKTSARLIDIPQAIAVIPPRLLQDLGALETKELYRHISGVTDSPYSSTVVRGFTQREVLVNGLRGNPFGSIDGDVNNSGFSTSQFRLTNVERVEILKGPSSVLYGSGEPGGVINYVTKKPQEQFGARATIGTGRFNQALAEAEVTGAADDRKRVLYRGAVYFEDRDTFRNNGTMRNAHVAAGLTFRPSNRTSLGLEYEYLDQDMGAHRLRGVPVDAKGTFLTDIRWTATEPTDFTTLQAHVVQARVDHRFTPRTRMDSTFRYLDYDRTENYHEPRGLTADGRSMQREFRDQLRTNADWSWAGTVSSLVTTGAVRHDVATGADVIEQDHLFRFATARQASRGGPVQNIALTSPVYGSANPAAYGLTAASYATDTARTRRSGAFAQDLMSLGPQWNLLVGGRVDHYDDEGRSAGLDLSATRTAVTGRAGVVYKPLPRLALYGSLANGFTRAGILSQTPSANGPHDPETAIQGEGGLKADLVDGRLQVTTAVFRATKRNVLRPDPLFGPSGTNTNAVLAVGRVRNSGFEFDVAGEPVKGWDLAFNYAYLHSRILEDTTASVVGQPMPNAAPHHLGLFSRVSVTRATALGVSLEHTATRVEPFAAIEAPAFTVVDAHVFHDVTARLRLRATLENLFNRRYATSSLFAARAGNFPGQPRTLSVALTVSTEAR